ncbi:MAG: zinc ribbon domain-containing protein, partial [Candidatus Hydrothermarchaeales archaeon]
MVECNECGGKLKKGDLFCSQCGAKISVMKPDSKAAKSRKAKPKAAKPGALKKEPVELTDEVKRRLKAELEISIKAFKRGDITLEE